MEALYEKNGLEVEQNPNGRKYSGKNQLVVRTHKEGFVPELKVWTEPQLFPVLGVSGGTRARLGPIRRRKGREEGVIGGTGASPYLHAGRAEPCGP